MQRWKQPWTKKQLRKHFKESLVIKPIGSVEGIKECVKKLNPLRYRSWAAWWRKRGQNKKASDEAGLFLVSLFGSPSELSTAIFFLDLVGDVRAVVDVPLYLYASTGGKARLGEVAPLKGCGFCYGERFTRYFQCWIHE